MIVEQPIPDDRTKCRRWKKNAINDPCNIRWKRKETSVRSITSLRQIAFVQREIEKENAMETYFIT